MVDRLTLTACLLVAATSVKTQVYPAQGQKREEKLCRCILSNISQRNEPDIGNRLHQSQEARSDIPFLARMELAYQPCLKWFYF